MSKDGATAFAQRLQSDEEFRTHLAEAPTPEERLRLAKDAGYDVGPDDIGTIRDAMGIEELSDEDLAKVAGGIGTGTDVGLALTIGIGTAAAIAAAV